MPCFKFLIYAPLLVLYVLVLVINNFCQQPDEQSTTQKTGIDPFPHVFLTQCFLLTLWINDSAHFHFSSKTSKTRHVRKTLQVRAEKAIASFSQNIHNRIPLCFFSSSVWTTDVYRHPDHSRQKHQTSSVRDAGVSGVSCGGSVHLTHWWQHDNAGKPTFFF